MRTSTSLDIDRYVSTSGKIQSDDIDWQSGKTAGLNENEIFTLTYFSDIESQTFRYMKMLMSMKTALQPEISSFLTIWNYEEYFHGYMLDQLLRKCGVELERNRLENVQKKAKLNEQLEKIFGPMVSYVFAKWFPAVYFSFGSIQELTTLRGYEHLEKITENPVLKILCRRIAKQERRHFAWYFNHAKAELEKSKGAQKLTRALLRFNWVPVGAGVKPLEEVERLFNFLFPDEIGIGVIDDIDSTMSTLPGLSDMHLMQNYFKA